MHRENGFIFLDHGDAERMSAPRRTDYWQIRVKMMSTHDKSTLILFSIRLVRFASSSASSSVCHLVFVFICLCTFFDCINRTKPMKTYKATRRDFDSIFSSCLYFDSFSVDLFEFARNEFFVVAFLFPPLTFEESLLVSWDFFSSFYWLKPDPKLVVWCSRFQHWVVVATKKKKIGLIAKVKMQKKFIDKLK